MKNVILVSLMCLMGGLVATGIGCQEVRRGVSGVMPYQETDFVLASREGRAFPIELNAGDSLVGSVQEKTGDYRALAFRISNPNGETIDEIVLKGKYNFIFKATVNGYYALHVSNFNPDSSKYIVLKYRRT